RRARATSSSCGSTSAPSRSTASTTGGDCPKWTGSAGGCAGSERGTLRWAFLWSTRVRRGGWVRGSTCRVAPGAPPPRGRLTGAGGEEVDGGTAPVALGPDARARVCDLAFPVRADTAYEVALPLRDASGKVLARNRYRDPFRPPPHPEGHPTRIDHELGM